MIETSMVYDSEYLYKVAAEAAIEGDNEKALEYLEKGLAHKSSAFHGMVHQRELSG
ncbi:MAG: hypothetical protein LUQ17_00805 [Methanomicrobiales archaeon]|nr:hypothetical protein [Methanomicrobiales archaeon]